MPSIFEGFDEVKIRVMTVFDETITGAAELRRQIKFSGGLKMGEAGCTSNTGGYGLMKNKDWNGAEDITDWPEWFAEIDELRKPRRET